ncbi:hypothetical protein QJS10_CPA01g02125 [Acorus calamus]|uniref:Uncharacterized protein n=1 Tax=Acorus calamus TaxID=4465 RepID=A0AAV9FWE8_ACOCL|nr:hypothetical protein QJS10_CPA01g02125 [Acorus calamus]
MLDEENKKLQKQLYKERQRQGSGGKLSSVSAKGKRKASPRIVLPITHIILAMFGCTIFLLVLILTILILISITCNFGEF